MRTAWFASPRVHFVPAARPAALPAVAAYLRDHVTDATVTGAARRRAFSVRGLVARRLDRAPARAAAMAPGDAAVLERKEMHPAVVEEGTDVGVAR